MRCTAEQEEWHKECLLPYVSDDVARVEQNDPDSMWSARERGNMEAEAFVLWYQLNQ